jgi:hypothetical protein
MPYNYYIINRVDINIPDYVEKGNSENTQSSWGGSSAISKLFVPVLLVLVGSGAYGAGRLTKILESRQPVIIRGLETATSTGSITSPQANSGQATSTQNTQINSQTGFVIQAQNNTQPATSTSVKVGKYLAARGGTVYYLPSCAVSKRILEKNRVWFDTKEEAEKLGYKPAQNCKGL